MGKTFLEDKRVGTVGEFVTWDYLQHMKGVRSVVDVRDDSFFQTMDVDFLMSFLAYRKGKDEEIRIDSSYQED